MRTLHEESMSKNMEIESRLGTLEQSVAKIDSIVGEQYRLIMGTRAIVGTQSQSQQNNILNISARLDNIYQMMNEMNQKLQAIQLYGGMEVPTPQTSSAAGAPGFASPGGEVAATQPSYAPIPPSSNVDPMEVYNAALADLKNGNYAIAESRFIAFLIQFPKHDMAGNAQYWLGEVDYAQKKFDLAIAEFEKVIKNYPKSEKVPAAMLKMAFAQAELGQKKTASATLQKLIKAYPKADEAKIARTKLRELQ